jgi:hypothetical protein
MVTRVAVIRLSFRLVQTLSVANRKRLSIIVPE